MSRTDLVRKAMLAIDAEANAIDPTTGNVLVNYAQAAVDAVLPQITNWEQLLHLPQGSIVVGRHGHGFVRKASRTTPWESATGWSYGSSNGDLTEISQRMIHHESPLTVVWQP